MTLPKLSAQQPIVTTGGKPSSPFLQFMEKARTAQEATDNTQNETLLALQAIVESIQGSTEQAHEAAAAANNAQAAADAVAGTGTVTGSATNPAINLTVGVWVNGPQVDLSSVLAGDLFITGSGPLQDADVTIPGASGFTRAPFEFRIVEIVSMVETTVFTGTGLAASGSESAIATVTNGSSPEVSAFVSARSSTGAVSYRIDARATTRAINSLSLYVFARRAS